jgi:hypothetical protein
VSVGSNQNVVVPPPDHPTFVRPDWIMSDVPASAYCHDMINRLMCVGVSSYRPTRDEAVVQANNAALEELVTTVGLKISDPFFRENVLPAYSEVRSKALSALQVADLERSSPAYATARDVVGKARKRVVEMLQLSGGAAVPAQRTDWYWEEYAGEHGKPNEVLVFVRYDIPLDAVRALVERYSETATILGSTAMTAFPGIAWQHEGFLGGAVVTKVGSKLAAAGVAPKSIVTAVNDLRVSDVSGFARHLAEAPKGPLALTVKVGDAPEQVVSVRR